MFVIQKLSLVLLLPIGAICNVWFQKISIPPPQRVIWKFRGGGGALKVKIFKGMYA